ncbi:hypothetical protein [Isoptericola sp. NPDC057391]
MRRPHRGGDAADAPWQDDRHRPPAATTRPPTVLRQHEAGRTT